MDNRPIIPEEFAARLRQTMAKRSISCRQLAENIHISFSSVSRYAAGLVTPKKAVAYAIAAHLKVDPVWLMGYETMPQKGLMPVERREVPMLGQIAAGEPIYAEGRQEFAGTPEDADFCLKVKGDSMIGARIYDGDTVFIHAQNDVGDGEIAVVLIDDEATLKRVYKMGDRVILRAENPAYAPMEFSAKDAKQVRILGKAIAFQGML